jgi:DNA-binding transcriptional MerR regulator
MKDSREQYTKRDISNILEGLSVRTVQYYTDFSIVTPDISPSQGRGKTRIYSERNLVEFAMVVYMSSVLKVDLDTIKTIMATLRKGRFENKMVSPGRVEKFDTFYSDEAWGTALELAYIHTVFPLESVKKGLKAMPSPFSFIEFKVVSAPTPLVGFDPEINVSTVSNRVLWLGNIKRGAVLEVLGMKSLLSTDVFSF